jgi:hypothetical protein
MRGAASNRAWQALTWQALISNNSTIAGLHLEGTGGIAHQKPRNCRDRTEVIG